MYGASMIHGSPQIQTTGHVTTPDTQQELSLTVKNQLPGTLAKVNNQGGTANSKMQGLGKSSPMSDHMLMQTATMSQAITKMIQLLNMNKPIFKTTLSIIKGVVKQSDQLKSSLNGSARIIKHHITQILTNFSPEKQIQQARITSDTNGVNNGKAKSVTNKNSSIGRLFKSNVTAAIISKSKGIIEIKKETNTLNENKNKLTKEIDSLLSERKELLGSAARGMMDKDPITKAPVLSEAAKNVEKEINSLTEKINSHRSEVTKIDDQINVNKFRLGEIKGSGLIERISIAVAFKVLVASDKASQIFKSTPKPTLAEAKETKGPSSPNETATPEKTDPLAGKRKGFEDFLVKKQEYEQKNSELETKQSNVEKARAECAAKNDPEDPTLKKLTKEFNDIAAERKALKSEFEKNNPLPKEDHSDFLTFLIEKQKNITPTKSPPLINPDKKIANKEAQKLADNFSSACFNVQKGINLGAITSEEQGNEEFAAALQFNKDTTNYVIYSVLNCSSKKEAEQYITNLVDAAYILVQKGDFHSAQAIYFGLTAGANQGNIEKYVGQLASKTTNQRLSDLQQLFLAGDQNAVKKLRNEMANHSQCIPPTGLIQQDLGNCFGIAAASTAGKLESVAITVQPMTGISSFQPPQHAETSQLRNNFNVATEYLSVDPNTSSISKTVTIDNKFVDKNFTVKEYADFKAREFSEQNSNASTEDIEKTRATALKNGTDEALSLKLKQKQNEFKKKTGLQ